MVIEDRLDSSVIICLLAAGKADEFIAAFERGAIPDDLKNGIGQTLLHQAIPLDIRERLVSPDEGEKDMYEGSLKIVRYLVEKADIGINTQDNNGGTALYLAARNHHPEIVDILIKNGADATIKSISHTPKEGILRAERRPYHNGDSKSFADMRESGGFSAKDIDTVNDGVIRHAQEVYDAFDKVMSLLETAEQQKEKQQRQAAEQEQLARRRQARGRFVNTVDKSRDGKGPRGL